MGYGKYIPSKSVRVEINNLTLTPSNPQLSPKNGTIVVLKFVGGSNEENLFFHGFEPENARSNHFILLKKHIFSWIFQQAMFDYQMVQ